MRKWGKQSPKMGTIHSSPPCTHMLLHPARVASISPPLVSEPWPCDLLCPMECQGYDILGLLRPGLKRDGSFKVLPLGSQLPFERSDYAETPML